MNIPNITGGVASICLALSLFSCAEDNYYDLGGEDSSTVNFKAVNLSVGSEDAASSTGQDYYYDLPQIDKLIPIVVYDPDYFIDGEMYSSMTEIRIDRESTIWTGGYAEIQVTFTPSVPEERSATFTMPDGSTHIATLENPSFIWSPDSTLRYMGNLYPEYTFIKAESKYVKGNTTYTNTGYIYVDINSDLRYEKGTDKWYKSLWIYGGSLTLPSH